MVMVAAVEAGPDHDAETPGSISVAGHLKRSIVLTRNLGIDIMGHNLVTDFIRAGSGQSSISDVAGEPANVDRRISVRKFMGGLPSKTVEYFVPKPGSEAYGRRAVRCYLNTGSTWYLGKHVSALRGGTIVLVLGRDEHGNVVLREKTVKATEVAGLSQSERLDLWRKHWKDDVIRIKGDGGVWKYVHRDVRLNADLSANEHVRLWLRGLAVQSATIPTSEAGPPADFEEHLGYLQSEVKDGNSEDIKILVALFEREDALVSVDLRGVPVSGTDQSAPGAGLVCKCFRLAENIDDLSQRQRVALWRAQCPDDLLKIEGDDGQVKLVHSDVTLNVELSGAEEGRLQSAVKERNEKFASKKAVRVAKLTDGDAFRSPADTR